MCCYRLNCCRLPDLFLCGSSGGSALYPPHHSNFSIIRPPLNLLFNCPAGSHIIDVIVCSMTVFCLHMLCLSLTYTFLSHMTPVTSFHLFQAGRRPTLFTSLPGGCGYYISIDKCSAVTLWLCLLCQLIIIITFLRLLKLSQKQPSFTTAIHERIYVSSCRHDASV